MLTLRRFKEAMITVLVVLLIGVAVTSARESDYGVTDDVYWDAFVDNVYYSESQDTTNSDHGYYVENGSTSNVTVDYEFTHRVKKGSAVRIEKKQTGSVTVYRRNHPRKKNPRSSHKTKNYEVDVSSLSGTGFVIDAYTRLTLIKEGSNIVDRTFKIVTDEFNLD